MGDSTLISVKSIETALGTKLEQVSTISGGSPRGVYRVDTGRGRFCVKTCASEDNASIAAERAGLGEIGSTATVNLPVIAAYGNDFLVLEWLNPRPATSSQWRLLARQLLDLHRSGAEQFGFHGDGFCGMSPQLNDWCSHGVEFFVTRRLQVQARRARDNDLISAADVIALDSLCGKLESYVPEMPAVLVHGDLWSGNVIFTDSSPYIIDPAAYYGWAETDLAMTRLFGGFPEKFYQQYFDLSSLPGGFNDRVDLYNLYHLLNHLNLFGKSYYQRVSSILKRYA
jgi:fructosamine-3-kinase